MVLSKKLGSSLIILLSALSAIVYVVFDPFPVVFDDVAAVLFSVLPIIAKRKRIA